MLGAFVFFLVNASLNREAVLDWGWRIPFLFGILLGAATLRLRRAVLVLDPTPPWCAPTRSSSPCGTRAATTAALRASACRR